jgi:anti-anti-sigma regulatory factor
MTDDGPRALTVVKSDVGGIRVLVLHGDLTLATIADFHAAVAPERTADRIVIDISDLAFVESAGLAAIVRFGRQRTTSRPAALVVGRPPVVASDLLRTLGAIDLFSAWSSRQEAIDDLR